MSEAGGRYYTKLEFTPYEVTLLKTLLEAKYRTADGPTRKRLANILRKLRM